MRLNLLGGPTVIRIGEFAGLAGVSIRALRFYDQERLLTPAHVDPQSGYRYYAFSQLDRLRQLQLFKDLGFPLAEIREFFRRRLTLPEMQKIMQDRKRELQQRMRDDSGRIERINARLLELTSAPESSAPPVVVRDTQPAWVASIREKIRSYEECEQLFLEIERRIPAAEFRGSRAALWHSCAQGRSIDCEAVRFLERPVRAAGPLRIYESPARQDASLFHAAGDETLPTAFRSMERWLEHSEYALRGPKWEIYWKPGPGDETLTEIRFPVERPRGRKRPVRSPAAEAIP